MLYLPPKNKRSLSLSLSFGFLLLTLPVEAMKTTALVPPAEKVAGVSRAEYAVRWWQWVNRLPNGVRAYQDPTGYQCALNQSGEVWFLAGTDGTDDMVRDCSVPLGKYIFFPVITMLVHARPGKSLSCDQAKAEAADNNNHLAWAVVEIDGFRVGRVERYRIRSENCFDAFPDAPYLKNPALNFPAATEGYWLMLKPLSAGQHRISVKAGYGNPGKEYGDLEQVFEYRISVVQGQPIDPKRRVPKKDVEGIFVAR